MCRYLAYLGQPVLLEDLVYKPANSLVHQAAEAMESPTRINADGFGVGWYTEIHPEPVVFKDISPVWNNANLGSLAGKVASPCILAHVRAAQRYDPVTRANCHPFQHDRILWMHNGDVPGRGRLHRRVAAAADDELVARIRGSTDSELAFTLFLKYLQPSADAILDANELAETLARTVRQLADWHAADEDTRPLVLNFCVTDGRVMAACRYARNTDEVPSLHYGTGASYSCDGETCRLLAGEGERLPGCAIITSEKLSLQADWQTIPPGSLVTVDESLGVTLRALGIDQ